MEITVRKLRKAVQESNYGSTRLRAWAKSEGLDVDTDPTTGDEVVLISDSFAMKNGLPEDYDWGVERSINDDGWIVKNSPDYGTVYFEMSSNDMSDLDDIDIDTLEY
tara:strand:+ start:250 stop:570 length:321 start_codon:yes stop_codon:yes gene_type:complete